MNRGWRRESYRHSLAARGIVTRRYFTPMSRRLSKRGPITLYHGTTADVVPKVAAEGLSGEFSEHPVYKNHVWGSTSPKIAGDYARGEFSRDQLVELNRLSRDPEFKRLFFKETGVPEVGPPEGSRQSWEEYKFGSRFSSPNAWREFFRGSSGDGMVPVVEGMMPVIFRIGREHPELKIDEGLLSRRNPTMVRFHVPEADWSDDGKRNFDGVKKFPVPGSVPASRVEVLSHEEMVRKQHAGEGRPDMWESSGSEVVFRG